jgi:hypothetical protein
MLPGVIFPAAEFMLVEDFVSNVLDNSVAPLFQHLARNETISERELEMLKDLLRRAEEKQK